MPAHLDRAEGWTLSMSVGAAVDFVVGRRPEKGSTYGEFAPHKPFADQTEKQVLFESGDLFLFRGVATVLVARVALSLELEPALQASCRLTAPLLVHPAHRRQRVSRGGWHEGWDGAGVLG